MTLADSTGGEAVFVRILKVMHEQLELPLFEPSSFRELCDRRGQSALTITVNPRLRRSWNMTVAAGTRHRTVHVPRWLDLAGEPVKEALIEWALLPVQSRKSRKGSADRERRHELEKFIFQQGPGESVKTRRTPLDPATFGRNHAGRAYDLKEIFDTVNHGSFGGTIEAFVRWGAHASLTSYQMVRETADGSRVNCITIAGVYDHPLVPRFALEAVMYHEMLHIAIPPAQRAKRRVVHSRAFREAERRCPHYSAWRHWEKTSLHSIRTRLRRERKRAR